jgi:hypothetical protein
VPLSKTDFSAGSEAAPFQDGDFSAASEAQAKLSGGFAVAEETERAEVVEVALTAAFGYGTDVVGVP